MLSNKFILLLVRLIGQDRCVLGWKSRMIIGVSLPIVPLFIKTSRSFVLRWDFSSIPLCFCFGYWKELVYFRFYLHNYLTILITILKKSYSHPHPSSHSIIFYTFQRPGICIRKYVSNINIYLFESMKCRFMFNILLALYHNC